MNSYFVFETKVISIIYQITCKQMASRCMLNYYCFICRNCLSYTI